MFSTQQMKVKPTVMGLPQCKHQRSNKPSTCRSTDRLTLGRKCKSSSDLSQVSAPSLWNDSPSECVYFE